MANQVLYGFNALKDVFGKRVTEVGVGVVADAIAATVAEHNRQMDALLGLFIRRTTDFKIRYRTASAARLQPMDEFGRALPIKTAGQYDIAFPIQSGAAAWGANYVARQKMTVGEANELTSALVSADVRWMRDHILAALYDNTSWTFTDDEHGSLTIKPLANGDSDVYMIITGSDAAATDTHYLAQAAGIADVSNPFPTIQSELVEHPENGPEVLVLAPTNLRASIEALSNFIPFSDPNIALGANSDRLVGSLGVQVPGEIIGYTDKCWISEWRAMPDNYMIGVNVGGEAPLGMREDVEPELRGFQQVAVREDHPFQESQWLRRAGFGAWNRVGAVVQRIGNAAYAIPTNYTTPMP